MILSELLETDLFLPDSICSPSLLPLLGESDHGIYHISQFYSHNFPTLALGFWELFHVHIWLDVHIPDTDLPNESILKLRSDLVFPLAAVAKIFDRLLFVQAFAGVSHGSDVREFLDSLEVVETALRKLGVDHVAVLLLWPELVDCR